MNEPIKRRNLVHAVATTPTDEPLSEDVIAEVAARNGFPNAAQASTATDHSGARRQRQPTGRVHQFNVRLRRDTLDFIYAQANGRNIPVAQVIEEMADALKRQKQGVP